MKKTMLMLKRGFTLIELLVVIAIIGILAAVVLASLNDARDGGKDASAKGSMTSIRNQAELFYNKNNYAYQTATDNMCGSADVDALIVAVNKQVAGTTTCIDEPTYYHAYVTLNNTEVFCIDSTGYAGKVASGSETQTTASGEVVCNPI